MNSGAPPASAPGECSSAGMMRSANFSSVLYSCSLKNLGLYAPFFFTSATAWCTCWAASAFTTLTPTVVSVIRSRSRRDTSWIGSDIAFPHFFGQVLGRAPRERDDGKRDVLIGIAAERRCVGDKQV